MGQDLESDGFAYTQISVDRVNARTQQQDQYAYFKTTMTDMRLKIYKECKFLTEEVLGLERLSDGHIEHPDAGRSGSKDQIDAVVGALWNASKHAEEYAYNYGDNIDASLSVSMKTEDSKDKKQLMADYQAELQKIYAELKDCDDERTQAEKAEYETWKDIADGIIVI